MVVGCLVVAGVAAGQPASVSPASLASRTAAVANAVQLSQQFPVLLGTGVALGLGLGVILGSVSMYKYWERRFSSEYQ
jgi:hypothetical protein